MPATRSEQEYSVEELYHILFKLRKLVETELDQEESLEQPSLYKTVRTVTTYGAYEDPI